MDTHTTEPSHHRARRNRQVPHPDRPRRRSIHAGHKVRYFTAADLVETLYRGLADNTVGKIIESLLRVDLIILDLCRPRNYADTSAMIDRGSVSRRRSS